MLMRYENKQNDKGFWQQSQLLNPPELMGDAMSEDNLQNNKCFIDWRGYGEDSEPYCERCDIELFDEWNHCPSCGRKIYSYIDGKEIVGWP